MRLILILSLLINFRYIQTNQTTPNPESPNDSHIEIVSPSVGLNENQRNHLIFWEKRCLIDPYSELETDFEIDGHPIDRGRDQGFWNNSFNEMEESIFHDQIYHETDITPFLEAISKRKKLSLTEYKNTGLLGVLIFFITMVVLLLLIVSFFTCITKKDKVIKNRPCCVKTWLAIISILLLISFILMMIILVSASNISRAHNDLLCEATRIPHTLIMGTPQIHFEIESKRKFLGLERILDFSIIYLDHFLIDPKKENIEILQKIRDTRLRDEMTLLKSASNNFKSNFADKTTLDAEGKQNIPISIQHEFPKYNYFLDLLSKRYELTVNRIAQINILTPLLLDESDFKTLKDDFHSAVNEIKDLEENIASFWNEIMTSTFMQSVTFRILLIGLILISVIIWISLVVSFCVFCKRTKRGSSNKIKDKSSLRLLLVLNLVAMLLGSISFSFLSSVTYSSFYACATMNQLKNEPQKTKTIIEKTLLKDEAILRIFDTCFSSPERNGNLNFQNLFVNEETKKVISDLILFIDALKILQEKDGAIMKDHDLSQNSDYYTKFENYKNGISSDFQNVHLNLSTLNHNFFCSDIIYKLDSEGCIHLPQEKTKCISILKSNFESDPCMHETKIQESETLFLKLKNHITAEQDHINPILEQIDGKSNLNSIAQRIKEIGNKYNDLISEIQQLTINIHLPLGDLASGHIENSLDCGAVRRDLDTTYDKMCRDHVWFLSRITFAAFFILIIGFFVVLIIFILTFCLKKESQTKRKKKKDDPWAFKLEKEEFEREDTNREYPNRDVFDTNEGNYGDQNLSNLSLGRDDFGTQDFGKQGVYAQMTDSEREEEEDFAQSDERFNFKK